MNHIFVCRYAFIEYLKNEDALRAIRAMHNKPFRNSTLVIGVSQYPMSPSILLKVIFNCFSGQEKHQSQMLLYQLVGTRIHYLNPSSPEKTKLLLEKVPLPEKIVPFLLERIVLLDTIQRRQIEAKVLLDMVLRFLEKYFQMLYLLVII